MKERTTRPFGVNLRSDAPDIDERAELMVKQGVRVASFAMAPGEKLMKRLKDAGLVCIPSIGAKRHAEKVAAWGADAVIVQGAEAGGHVGEVPTTVLLPQVVDAVDIPVIAAGGFFDGRGLVAALAYGAAGIAMGTRFLLTSDSPVPEAIKKLYLGAGHRHRRDDAGRRLGASRAAHALRRAAPRHGALAICRARSPTRCASSACRARAAI